MRQRPDLYDPTAFGGETYDSLVARSTAVIEELNRKYPHGKILIVAHGVLLITLINVLTGRPKAEWRKGSPLANTSLSILEKPMDGPYQIKVFNDISYQSNHEEA